MIARFYFILLAIVGIVNCVKARNTLVFGGNGFLGSAFVDLILGRGDNVTIVNRGNWYWDSRTRILPHVRHVRCDRNKRLAECAGFQELYGSSASLEGRWDSVVDFSAYTKDQLQDALEMLKDATRSYFFISTDSVYDVCDPPEGEPVKEVSAKRPDDATRRNTLNYHHSYAHEKLSAEEYLQEFRSSGGPPFVILRMPDIIGPRDTTYRFWIYQMWIKLASVITEIPVGLPNFLVDYSNSFVYVDDVANLLERLTQTNTLPGDVIDQVYNLAWDMNITMIQLLRTVEKQLNISKQDFQILEDTSALYLYPTVRVGPVDVNKAKEKLAWTTTDFDQAIKTTVDFYESVMTDPKFKVQRDEIIQIVLNHLYSKDANKFFGALEKTYAISLTHFKVHDEL